MSPPPELEDEPEPLEDQPLDERELLLELLLLLLLRLEDEPL